MFISREELSFDFQGARFDLQSESDRGLLGWIFDQFLYGEVTGIQCGWWLYKAPHLDAAVFLARQAGEELSHVRRILKILELLGQKPQKAHRAVRFLATGMMGHSWGEHVAIEMALGEGLVLGVFYAMADTIADPEIHRILETAIVEEERHVEFGEKETLTWLQKYPGSRRLLLGLAFVQVLALRFLKRFVLKKIVHNVGVDHSVMSQFEAFYDQTVRLFETRIERLGLSTVPLSRMGFATKLSLVIFLPLRMIGGRWAFRVPSLTKTYLEDPGVTKEPRNQS